MKLGRVVGTVVSTINVPVYESRTLLLCDLLAPDGSPAGGYLIAVDTVGAGAGETVLILDEGNSARQVLEAREAPVRTLVVGIVDAVELEPSGWPERDEVGTTEDTESTAPGARRPAGGEGATRPGRGATRARATSPSPGPRRSRRAKTAG